MFTTIRKRDGRVLPFDASKITAAIAKAGSVTEEFDDDVAHKLTIKVLSIAEQTIADIPTVEAIQDIVEEVLLQSMYRKTAKAYIIYRDQHAKIRDIKAGMGVDLIDQYLEKLDWQVNENSNMAFSLQGLNNYLSSEISKIYWLNKIYPPEVRNAHSGGTSTSTTSTSSRSTAWAGISTTCSSRDSRGPRARSRASRPDTSAQPWARS